MNIAILSDTHGRTKYLQAAKPVIETCDAVIHLGDGALDLNALNLKNEVIRVRGNNDFTSILPDFLIKEYAGRKIFITHGHRYGVKQGYDGLTAAARETGCVIALFGHTHMAEDTVSGGVRCFNPGALSPYTYGGGSPSYAIMHLDDRGVSFRLFHPIVDY